MTERPTIGQILVDVGRVTEEEVERALDYQRRHGGFFGEALLALGVVTEDEVDWSLASQLDLPYVFPDADAIDPEAASLVTPGWALVNLTLPILRTERTLTVIVDSPGNAEAIEELRRRTGLDVELALASGDKIREMIREVYSRIAEEESSGIQAPVPLVDWVERALERRSARFGISGRGSRATAWYEEERVVHRFPLTRGWREELEETLTPPPSERVTEASGGWTGYLSRDGAGPPVEVRYLKASQGDSGGAGVEYLFRPVRARGPSAMALPPTDIRAEVRLIVRSGAARIAVSTDPHSLLGEILPLLPRLFLEPDHRAVHITGEEGEVEGVFTVPVPSDAKERTRAFEGLRAFRFDAATIDLPGSLARWIAEALEVASVVFVPCRSQADLEVAERAGVRWALSARRSGEDPFEWSLGPLES